MPNKSISSPPVSNFSAPGRLRAIAAMTILIIALHAMFNVSNAAIEQAKFDSPEQTQRYQDLILELRCLVCQNQNIADSDADLAKDLRRKTREMILAGESDQQIREYMRERYGDFVLYKPPFEKQYWALWGLPIALLLIILFGLLRYLKGRQNSASGSTSKSVDAMEHEALERAAKLLSNKENSSS